MDKSFSEKMDKLILLMLNYEFTMYGLGLIYDFKILNLIYP